jgi:hypothetical protein
MLEVAADGNNPLTLLAGVHFAVPSRHTISVGRSCPDLARAWS